MTSANANHQPHSHNLLQPHDFNGVCPICGGAMVVTRLECVQCGSALDGAFHLTSDAANPTTAQSATANQAQQAIPAMQAQLNQLLARFGRLARLDPAQLEFVEVFLRSRGVIKNVEDVLGVSYPTVKARLANVLDAMGFGADEEPPSGDERQWRRQILADLRDGRITAAEAHRRLADAPGASAERD